MDESNVLRLLAHISTYLFQLSYATPEQLKTLRGQLRRQYDDKKPVSRLFLLMHIGGQHKVAH